jgi:hypothetical protein
MPRLERTAAGCLTFISEKKHRATRPDFGVASVNAFRHPLKHPQSENHVKKIDLEKRLRDTVYELARPCGRVVGTQGHEDAKNYLTRRLQDIGCLPYTGGSFELPYGPETESFCNLVGVVPGKDRSLPPVLIGAHYDSVIKAPCADDNAAAVAITLMLGELFRESSPPRDILLVIFDAEEPPYFCSEQMGSIRFFEDQMKPEGVHAAMVMDLVGHAIELPIGKPPGLKSGGTLEMQYPGLSNLLFITGAESHPHWEQLIEQAEASRRLPVVFSLNQYVGDMSDHGIFLKNRVPYVFLSCGRWKHYHQPSDTPDRLDYGKMTLITRYAEKLIQAVAETESLQRSKQDCDTTALEIRHIQDSFGPVLPLMLEKFGIKRLETRRDIDKFAGGLLARGL